MTGGTPEHVRTRTLGLAGKVALVTGATRGLGRAIASGLADAGCDLVVASRRQEACDELAAELQDRAGRVVLPVACHVGRWSDVDALVEQAYRRFGRLDLLVNNAGMSPLYPSLSSVGEELFDKVVGVNLKGPFRLCAVVGERMTQGGGAILNVSSVAATRASPESLPYAAAKAGLNALTRGLAVALGPTVRVNAVMAGPFETSVASAWSAEYRERVASYPLGRIGDPAEIVGPALFLLSSEASFVTGAVLAVDGGMDVTPV